jgi:HK97 family phage portal protein
MKRYGTTLSKKIPAGRNSRSARSGAAITNAGMLVSSPVLSGILVTPQTAMNFTSVFSAVNVISTDLASLPFGTFKRIGENARVPAPEIQSARMMSLRPNDETNAYRFRQALMGHVLLWGNGYAEIVRDGRGQPTTLWLLNPALVQPKRELDGTLFYLLNDNMRKLLPENVIHVAGLGFDGLVGFSAIHMCRQSVGLGIASEEFGASFFGNGAIPRGYLKTPRKLSTTARQNLRESYYQVHQTTKNAHHLMLLEEGLEWGATTMPLEDAQFLATRQFQNLEIARIFRLPPHKLGDYSQSHLANIEESNRSYVETTLAGWALAIESEFDNKLLFDSERQASIFWYHNFARLERGNTAARTAYYTSMRNMGAMSADDIRVSEGMNPLGSDKGGDLYLVQAQYHALKNAGDPTYKPTSPPPGNDSPPDKGSSGKEGSMNGRLISSRHFFSTPIPTSSLAA